MEPIIVGAAIGGAAGAFVKNVAEKGVDWLVSLVAAHSPAVQLKAKQNTEAFMNRLARRVEMLERELPTEKREVFENALSHPSSSLLIQKTLISAAVTDNDDRHEILSELIAQRLCAGADDMISLVGGAACDVVSSLAPKHIRLLGVLATTFNIRPLNPPTIESQKDYQSYVLKWWDERMTVLLNDEIDQVNQWDFRHLLGLSCIHMSIGTFNLNTTLSLKVLPNQLAIDLLEFEQLPWWTKHKRLWEIGMMNSSCTSIGNLIGILFRDSLSSNKTKIDWT